MSTASDGYQGVWLDIFDNYGVSILKKYSLFKDGDPNQITFDDLDELMNHYKKNDIIKNIQLNKEAEYLVDGWRLPNLEELRKMFSMTGYNFKDDWYMTSECPNMMENMCVHYGDRREVVRKTEESHWGCCYIRLIKDK